MAWSGRVGGVVCLAGAAAFWGTTGAVVSGVDANGAVAAALVELTAGVVLVLAGYAVGYRLRVHRTYPRQWLALGVLEAVNVLSYYVALQFAPVAPVMALHLTAPVLLMLLHAVRGTRRLNPVVLLVLSSALVVLGLAGREDGGSQVVLGLALSLGSAVCLAAFISGVAQVTQDVDPLTGSGAGMALSGLLLTPFVALSPPPAGEGVTLVVLGAVLFAPACFLYWLGLRRLSAVAAGSVLLLEPVFGSATALLLFGERVDALHLVAGGLILLAVLLQVRVGEYRKVIAG